MPADVSASVCPAWRAASLLPLVPLRTLSRLDRSWRPGGRRGHLIACNPTWVHKLEQLRRGLRAWLRVAERAVRPSQPQRTEAPGRQTAAPIETTVGAAGATATKSIRTAHLHLPMNDRLEGCRGLDRSNVLQAPYELCGIIGMTDVTEGCERSLTKSCATIRMANTQAAAISSLRQDGAAHSG